MIKVLIPFLQTIEYRMFSGVSFYIKIIGVWPNLSDIILKKLHLPSIMFQLCCHSVCHTTEHTCHTVTKLNTNTVDCEEKIVAPTTAPRLFQIHNCDLEVSLSRPIVAGSSDLLKGCHPL